MAHLDIISMFWNAGLVVKMVMLFLLVFSLMSWYIIFHKYMLFKKAEKESEDFLNAFWQSKNMAEANKRAMELRLCPEAAVFRAGFTELQKLKASRSDIKNGAGMAIRFASMDNLKRTLRRTESQQLDSFGKLLPFLATTGSATPFVGLFGTVWGIMSSFKEIGIRGSASLAVVAPGISEALVATAAGLAVAIPAVIFFNHYSNKMARIEGSMQNFSDDFLNLVERDILSKLQAED